MTDEIKQAMKHRDQLHKDKKFEEFKQQHMRIKYLICEARKNSFQTTVQNENNISAILKSLISLTGKSRTKPDIPNNLMPDVFHHH